MRGQRLLHFLLLSCVSAAGLLSCLQRRDDDTSSAEQECSVCHGGPHAEDPSDRFLAAPPYNLSGDTERSARGNGAHLKHLLGSETSRALACDECHLVPTTTYAEGHLDSTYPAEIVFKGVAKAFKADPSFNTETASCENTFCHGGYFVGGRDSGGLLTEPSWIDTSGAPAQCGACHALPPPLPHPIRSQCSDCHKTMDEQGNIIYPDLHVNGVVNFNLPAQ